MKKVIHRILAFQDEIVQICWTYKGPDGKYTHREEYVKFQKDSKPTLRTTEEKK